MRVRSGETAAMPYSGAEPPLALEGSAVSWAMHSLRSCEPAQREHPQGIYHATKHQE